MISFSKGEELEETEVEEWPEIEGIDATQVEKWPLIGFVVTEKDICGVDGDFEFLEKNDLFLSKCDESGWKHKVLATCFGSKVVFSAIVMIFGLPLNEIIS